jgi:4-aminobutyrate aminotransferase
VDTQDAPALDLAGLAGPNMSPVLGRYMDRSWSHGVGHRLYDTAGREYLDFANGIAVTALGHAHPRVTAAVHAQVDRLMGPVHAMGFAEPTVKLAAMLAETFPDPLDTVLFLNSGSETIDGAIKLARRVTGRPAILAFRGGFHGRTIGATSVTTSSLNYRRGYEPLLPSVYTLPFPAVYRDFDDDEDAAIEACLAHLDDLLATTVAPSQVAGILIEPVQGEGGYYPAPPRFLQALRSTCDEHGILLLVDEVQSGFGRTGEMWAFQHAGIVPDAVMLAKAIANGLPLSAIVTSRALQQQWGRGAHGTTYGGNPVACAAGVAVRRALGRPPGADGGPPLHRRRARTGAHDRRGVRDGPRDPRAGRRHGRGRRGARGGGGPAGPDLRHPPPDDPLDPAAGRDSARDRGGAARVRGRAPGLTRPPARPAGLSRFGGSTSSTTGWSTRSGSRP